MERVLVYHCGMKPTSFSNIERPVAILYHRPSLCNLRLVYDMRVSSCSRRAARASARSIAPFSLAVISNPSLAFARATANTTLALCGVILPGAPTMLPAHSAESRDQFSSARFRISCFCSSDSRPSGWWSRSRIAWPTPLRTSNPPPVKWRKFSLRLGISVVIPDSRGRWATSLHWEFV